MPLFDFEGFADGTLLDVAYPSLPKLTDSNSSTATINGGNLDYNWVSGGSTLATYAYNTGDPDHYIEATYAQVRKGNFYTVVVRCASDARNFIGARITTGNNLELIEIVAGLGTTLSTDAVTLAIGSVLRVETEGNDIRAYFDGVLIRTVTTVVHNTNTRAGFNVRAAIALQVLSAATIDVLAAPVLIDEINGGDPLAYGDDNQADISGFTQAPDSVVVGGVSQSIDTASTTSVEFPLAFFVDGEIRDDPIADQEVIISVDDEVATTTHPVDLPINWDSIVVEDAVTDNPLNIFYTEYGIDSADENKIILDTEGTSLVEGNTVPNFTITADGFPQVVPAYVGTKVFWLWIASTGEMVEITLPISQSGVDTGGITMRGVTMTGITMRGITARGL